MIANLKFGKKYDADLLNFIINKDNLYITKDNRRIRVGDILGLKALYRTSSLSLRKENNGTTSGLLFVWKSNSIETPRYYVKLAYNNISDADDLLMMLNWKFMKEVYVKLDKNSMLVNSFRKKGFRFCYSREDEILLFRGKNERQFIAPLKEEDLDE